MANKVALYTNTIRHLKARQLWYRAFYALRNQFSGKQRQCKIQNLPATVQPLQLRFETLLESPTSYAGNNKFTFLNTSEVFGKSIDWNSNQHGKLWTYNLCYFDFLHQRNLPVAEAKTLINDFSANYEQVKDGLEPFPTSLRIMNLIKFVSKQQVQNRDIDRLIYSDWLRLRNNLEFHLMGNHLLENAFALLFGACYFNDASQFGKAQQLLTTELNEQILADGAHFELTPMYHQIMLGRVLESIHLLKQNTGFQAGELLPFLQKTAALMLGWLEGIAFNNGDVPHVNDSVDGIAPSLQALQVYALGIGLLAQKKPLSASGYRKFERANYELFVDVGHIGPDYIPGHAHSDTLNFVLYYKDRPLIVDTGISTYEKNELRNTQRSTAAHNTVMVNEQEQSEIWGGFRVAKRAKSSIIDESPDHVVASHNGYQNLGITHQRAFSCADDVLQIVDQLNKAASAKAFLHFHPDCEISLSNNQIQGDFGHIHLNGSENIDRATYQFAEGFNKTTVATVLTIEFFQKLEITFHFE